jgi:hypothetical protein
MTSHLRHAYGQRDCHGIRTIGVRGYDYGATRAACHSAPAGNTAFLTGHALGTQNYICLPSPSEFSWTLFGPQATLFVTFDTPRSIASNFVSLEAIPWLLVQAVGSTALVPYTADCFFYNAGR